MTASLVQFAISRSLEFEADRGGAEIAGGPAVLADALEKIEACARGIRFLVAEAHPATAQMMISNPLRGGAGRLVSTRPAIAERVSRLRALASGRRDYGFLCHVGAWRFWCWSRRMFHVKRRPQFCFTWNESAGS